MEIETRQEGRALVIKPLEESLDSGNAANFKSKMVDYALREQVYIALDMSRIQSMDNAGLSALLSTLKTLRGRGRLVLFNTGVNVDRILAITRLDKTVFEMHPDEQNAVNALNTVDEE